MKGQDIMTRSRFAGLAFALFAICAIALCSGRLAYAADEGSLAAAGAATALDAQAAELDFEKAATTSGSITWNATTRTVTMTNANVNLGSAANSSKYGAVIVSAYDSSIKPTVTLELVGSNTITGGNGGYPIWINDANLIVKGSGSLTIKSPNCSLAIWTDGFFTAQSGTISVDGAHGGIWAGDDINLSGARVSISNVNDDGLTSMNGGAKLSSGSLTVQTADTGLSVSGDLELSGTDVNMSNLAANALYTSYGSVVAKSGSVTVNSCHNGLSCSKALSMSGATISIRSASSNAVSCQGFAMSSGSLIADSCEYGISSFGDASISGGTLRVTGATYDALLISGRLVISGGAVTANATGRAYAISATRGMSNTVASLKSVVGALSTGATFVAGGNTYTVQSGGLYGSVALKTYGSSSKKVTVNTVSFGGVSYDVSAIGAKAFANKKGKAVTSLTLGSNVRTIGSKAFYGLSKLKTLNVKKFYYGTASIGKAAFSKCGKSSGKKLTVKCASKYERKLVKKALTKKGLSKKAKFK